MFFWLGVSGTKNHVIRFYRFPSPKNDSNFPKAQLPRPHLFVNCLWKVIPGEGDRPPVVSAHSALLSRFGISGFVHGVHGFLSFRVEDFGVL